MNCIRCGVEMNSTTGGNYTCPKCDMGVNDLVDRIKNCDMPIPEGFGVWQGWVCPKCGKVLAPWRSECDCYRQSSSTITTTETQSLPLEYTTSTNLNSDWNNIK